MPIVTVKCYLSSCEKEQTFDSLYCDKFLYCSGECYQKSFDNTITKYEQK
ncbi:hypothetical protein [Spiroplasma sp. AdecLV25b]|nr:hypothetical protein [Spiroplasma sp. AdecLV25b]